MNTNYSLGLCTAAAGALALYALFVTAAGGRFSAAEGGLVCAVAAIGVLILRLVRDEKRIEALEKKFLERNEEEEPAEEREDDAGKQGR